MFLKTGTKTKLPCLPFPQILGKIWGTGGGVENNSSVSSFSKPSSSRNPLLAMKWKQCGDCEKVEKLQNFVS